MASLTRWTWIWVNSRSWWWTGRPGVLRSMGSQLGMTERLNWTELLYNILVVLPYIDMNLPWVDMCSPSWAPLPPPIPSHPSGSSQCTSPERPVSCIEPGLAICFTYDNIHVSVLFSQIIPPSPSLKDAKRLFYTSVSLLLSCVYGHCYHLSRFHIYALVYSIGVFLSDLLHSV